MTRLAPFAAALLAAAPAFALEPITGTEADHAALRQLKDDLVAAVNTQDFDALGRLLNEPFTATVVTQDRFSTVEDGRTYFESLFSRDLLKMESISFSAEADDLSTLYTGTVAVTTGSTVETYTLADGRSFDVDGKWTAISVKDGDAWKLAAFQEGANILDNPVFNAVRDSVMKTGAMGAAIGLVMGLLGGWILGRMGRRRRAR